MKAQRDSISEVRPGIAMKDIDKLAFRALLEGLVKIGLLVGEIDEMFKNDVHYSFMPHSLGHYIGFKTHDVGLQINPDKLKNKDPNEIKESLKKYEAVNSAVLEKGMVTTIEPGIYFIDILIENAKTDEKLKGFFVFDKIKEYMEVGGVRIEDCVLVTESGNEVLTKVI